MSTRFVNKALVTINGKEFVVEGFYITCPSTRLPEPSYQESVSMALEFKPTVQPYDDEEDEFYDEHDSFGDCHD